MLFAVCLFMMNIHPPCILAPIRPILFAASEDPPIYFPPQGGWQIFHSSFRNRPELDLLGKYCTTVFVLIPSSCCSRKSGFEDTQAAENHNNTVQGRVSNDTDFRTLGSKRTAYGNTCREAFITQSLPGLFVFTWIQTYSGQASARFPLESKFSTCSSVQGFVVTWIQV